MSKTSKIIVIVLIIAMLLLGIGYAAIQNITLNITGNAEVDANFLVKFTKVTAVSDEEKVKASITDDTNAAIDVSGLTAKGDTVTATYEIENASSGLSADLLVEAVTRENADNISVKADLAKISLKAGETTTVIVTVTLNKTLITDEDIIDGTIDVELTAIPVQPGEEGTSEGLIKSEINPTTTTLASVTNANIGDYISLGNNVVGTESTADDWRILYVEDNTVYAILADYLPNSTGYASSAGLITSDDNLYGVWSETSSDDLLTRLTTTTYWSGLANGIEGATVTGSPTADLFYNSYNTENGTSKTLGDDGITGDLYVPHTSRISSCDGYWLASTCAGDSRGVWGVNYDGYVGNGSYINGYLAARPVVSLTSDINAELVDGVWTVEK